MKHEILLINPPADGLDTAYEHLGLGYIAACLREKGYGVDILDAPLYCISVQDILATVRRGSYKLVGVSIPFQTFAIQAVNFVRALKEMGLDFHITVGGIFPTFAYQELLEECPSIDSIILGEGEETFVELAGAVLQEKNWHSVKGLAYRGEAGVEKSEIRPLVEELDRLPFPVRDTLPRALEVNRFVSMLTSRGCWGRCSFCSVVSFFSAFGPKIRWRSTENVLEELSGLYSTYGVRNIMFNDANFFARKREDAAAIAEGILSRGWKINFSIQCRVDDIEPELFRLLSAAGLTRVFVGVESGSQSVLNRFHKDVSVADNLRAVKVLADLGIYVSMGFIMFDDRITYQEFSENLQFIKEVKAIMPKGQLQSVYTLGKVLPLSGTEVEKSMKEQGIYVGKGFDCDYEIRDPQMSGIYRSMKKLDRMMKSVYRLIGVRDHWEQKWLRTGL